MEFHPLANLFPLLEGAEFTALAEDIRANGVREPVVLLDGKILDGRNRWRASQHVGVTAPTVEFDGDDAMAFVISLNLHRRHLNESQRAMVASKVASNSHGGDRRSDQAANLPVETQAKVAELLNVGERSVRHAVHVRSAGAPELVEAVEQGRITVSQASQIATRCDDEQQRIVSRVNAGEKPVAAVRAVLRESLPDRVADLPTGQYRVFYADPPWQYGDERAGLAGYSDSAAAAQYPTMPLAEICVMNVKGMAAPDSVLFLWATFPLLPDALEVVKAWGFTYKTAFVWDKQRPNMGNYHNACAELLLVATRGSCTPEIDTRFSQVQTRPRGRHSEKPDDWRRMIDDMYPTGPRVELFRRGDAPKGWTVWGNEAA